MTEEQRRQAAAKRCADLANEFSWAAWEPEDFTEGVGVQAPLFNTILELDKLARIILSHSAWLVDHDTARQHILPDPKPSLIDEFMTEVHSPYVSTSETAWEAGAEAFADWIAKRGVEVRP